MGITGDALAAAAYAAQVITLAFLVWQIKLNRDQVKVSERALSLAARQHEEARAQAEQDRIDSVRPGVAVIQDSYVWKAVNAESPERYDTLNITYVLKNYGRGPAVNVELRFIPNNHPERAQTSRVHGIYPGGVETTVLYLGRISCDGQLRVRYHDVFGTEYTSVFDLWLGTSQEEDLFPILSDAS